MNVAHGWPESDPPEEPPESWPEERERLEAQAAAVQAAEREASEHAGRLGQELRELRAAAGREAARRAQGARRGPSPEATGELEAALTRLGQALDAKGRRLQMLSALCAMPRTPEADPEAVAGGAPRAALEADVADLRAQLGGSEKEVQRLEQWKEGQEQADREMRLLAEAQKEQLERLSAALAETSRGRPEAWRGFASGAVAPQTHGVSPQEASAPLRGRRTPGEPPEGWQRRGASAERGAGAGGFGSFGGARR